MPGVPLTGRLLKSPFHVDRVISNLNEKVGLIYIDCITLYITNMLLSDDRGRGWPFALAKDDKNIF